MRSISRLIRSGMPNEGDMSNGDPGSSPEACSRGMFGIDVVGESTPKF
jgi:hypothetical protein